MKSKLNLSIIPKILLNKWFIVFVSIFNCAYTIGLGAVAYAALFLKMEYLNATTFAILYSLLSVIVGFLMYYTRKSFLTGIFAVINIILFLPIALLLWGEWALIIPAAIVTIFGFAVCSINETLKVVFGTVFLLVYIVAVIAFYLIATVFSVVTTDTLIESGISPSGNFRWETYNVENKSSGKTVLYIEPNNLDFDIANALSFETTLKKKIKQENNPTTFVTKWEDNKFYINDNEFFDEEDYLDENGDYDFEEGNWTHTYFDLDYPVFDDVKKYWDILVEKTNEFLGNDPENLTE